MACARVAYARVTCARVDNRCMSLCWTQRTYIIEDGALGGVAHRLALLRNLVHALGGCRGGRLNKGKPK